MEARATSSTSSASSSSSSSSFSSSISSLLTPWLDVLVGARVVWAPPPEDDEATDCRVVATIHVQLQRLLNIHTNNDPSNIDKTIQHVRQAMELLRMAFLADADVLTQLARDGCITTIEGDTPSQDALQFPSRDLHFVLCYTASSQRCAAIHRAIARHLLKARPLCAGEVFQTAFDDLLRVRRCSSISDMQESYKWFWM